MSDKQTWTELGPREEMSLPQRVAAAGDALRDSEQRVATWIALHLVETAAMSAGRLAEAVGVSDASVMRTARALGYDGFTALKEALHRDLSAALSSSGPKIDMRTTSMRDRPDDYLSGMRLASHQLVDEMHRRLSPSAIRAAATIIAGADTTHSYGVGPSGIVAEYATLRLRRMGRRALAARSTGFRFADDLVSINEGDAVILFAPGRLHPEMEVLLAATIERKIPVLAVTDTLMPLLAERVAHVFWAPFALSGAPGETFTSMQIADILIDAVGSVDPPLAEHAYDRLSSTREAIVRRTRKPIEP